MQNLCIDPEFVLDPEFVHDPKSGGKVKVGDKKRGTQLDSSLESGRRDSNPRPSAWKANALSTELLPQF